MHRKRSWPLWIARHNRNVSGIERPLRHRTFIRQGMQRLQHLQPAESLEYLQDRPHGPAMDDRRRAADRKCQNYCEPVRRRQQAVVPEGELHPAGQVHADRGLAVNWPCISTAHFSDESLFDAGKLALVSGVASGRGESSRTARAAYAHSASAQGQASPPGGALPAASYRPGLAATAAAASGVTVRVLATARNVDFFLIVVQSKTFLSELLPQYSVRSLREGNRSRYAAPGSTNRRWKPTTVETGRRSGALAPG